MNYLKINVNSANYYKLSKEEKLRCVKTKLNALFNDKIGKTITIVYKGKKMTIPYDKQGIVKDLIMMEKALEKRVSISFKYDFEKEKVNSNRITSLLYTGNDETYPLPGFFPFDNLYIESENDFKIGLAEEKTNENIPERKLHLITESSIDEDEDLSAAWNSIFKNNTCDNKKNTLKYLVDKDGNFVSAYFVPNKTNSKKYKKERVTAVNQSQKSKNGILVWLIGLPIIKNRYKCKYASKKGIKGLFKRNKRRKSFTKKEKKGFVSGILAIPFVKKIVDKRKSKQNVSSLIDKDKTKRKKTAIVTWALITSLLLGGIGLAKKSNKNNGKIFRNHNDSVTDVWEPTEDDVIITETSTVMEETTVLETEPMSTENVNPIEPVGTETTSEDNKYSFSFDDKVTIDDDASIYYSSYDAVNNINELNPLFDGSYKRDIDGIVYNLNGDIYTIYSNDVNAYEKAQELINRGAKEEALLVTRSDLRGNSYYDNQYEGYYDIDNVKVLTRHK